MEESSAENKENLLGALVRVVPIVFVLMMMTIYIENKLYLGIIMLIVAILAPVLYKLAGQDPTRMLADIFFGMFDVGGTAALAAFGAITGGVFGAVIGTIAGDAILNAFSGIVEGSVANWMRKRGISDARTAMMSGMGKLSGGLLSGGFVLIIVWVNLV